MEKELYTHLQSLPVIKGIIQVGASSGQEVGGFKSFTNNIILCEPLPHLNTMLANSNPDCLVIPYAIGSSDEEEVDFYIASNNGESSSLKEPINHLTIYPNVKFDKSNKIKVRVRKFKSVVEEFNIDPKQYNVLTIDTQGNDLQVIKGFEDLITGFDLVIAEFDNVELYREGDTSAEMEKYLTALGFVFVEIYGGDYGIKNGSGNIVFKNKKII